MTSSKTSAIVLISLILAASGLAQSAGSPMAEMISLRDKIANPDTRTRVAATHRVWTLALASPDSEVKMTALQLLTEPVKSASDHIRMPAVYAMAEIANSTSDPKVKVRALELLYEPINAGQVPIRDVAIDAVNIIIAGDNQGEVAAAAVKALRPAVNSGNNGVRIPAIVALVHAVQGSHNETAAQSAIEALQPALESEAMIGGMEVRMMAVVALERIGVEASETGTKARALGLLESYAGKSSWEAEARQRAQEAAGAVQATMKK